MDLQTFMDIVLHVVGHTDPLSSQPVSPLIPKQLSIQFLKAKHHWFSTKGHVTYGKLLVYLVSDLFPMESLEGAEPEEWPM